MEAVVVSLGAAMIVFVTMFNLFRLYRTAYRSERITREAFILYTVITGYVGTGVYAVLALGFIVIFGEMIP
ncbi:hypothetical protein [Jeotgalibacillus sp. R-1-5s-1]|uniref:hypothetical protein n=1 Tax=Jeotgalibacillus sp. R-1-5s-1 TaxID=2555897 RepID=UPI00106BE2D7|nr:hypothetical protein [Jeotgalibacillus sp. R-1-5s-1]TFE00123.1 hypothetical protein E2491_06700 [Jeotgalibacillus sp. R-1-5s-1]